MEALRMAGNQLFRTEPAEAAKIYEQAMDLYDSKQATSAAAEEEPEAASLDEYSRCAGNALTALFNAGHYERCRDVALRALRVNPMLAKANGFLGKVSLKLQQSSARRPQQPSSPTPLMYLCRSLLLLPELAAPLASALQEAIEEESRAMEEITEAEDERTPATAANVMVEAVPGMGNSVVAHCVLMPPTVLEELRNPFSVGVYEEVCDEKSGGCCVHCASSLPLSTEGSMLGCSQCELVRYCSPSCRSSHQAQHTAYECAALSKLKRVLPQLRQRSVDVPENFFELAFHCITTLAALRSHCEGCDVVSQLEAHTQEVAQHTHPAARVVYDLLNGEVPEERIATVIGITTCNAVEVVDDRTGQGVAQGLYASAASFFNHSCHPNCSLDAGRRTIVNIRRVKSGQQLCISYIPQLYWPASRRQAALQNHFFFSCRCERCETSRDDAFEKCLEMRLPNRTATTSSEVVNRVESACQTIRSLSIGELTPKHTQEVEGMLQEATHHFFGSHYLFQEIHNTLSFLYTASEEYEKCFYTCMSELQLWECVVSGALPVKRMKVQNALACLSSMSTEQAEKAMRSCPLAPHLSRLAHMYGVEDEDEEEQCDNER